MTTIAEHKVITLQYEVKDEAGETIDKSSADAPLVYLHGYSNIIPGLENALVGKTTGDALQVTVAPEDAYGVYNETLVNPVPLAMFEGIEKVEVGMGFTAETPEGPVEVSIVEVSGDFAKVDANHPLAGKTLSFDVTVTDIRDASDEELSHGHVHGAGGHQH
jgi:FKBP-type peptidyl-prolyl cis-trans isomerase SlyD